MTDNLLWIALINIFTIISHTNTFSLPFAREDDASVCCVRDEWAGHMFLDFGTVFIDSNTAFSYINGTVHTAYSYSRKKVYFGITGVEQSPLMPKPGVWNTTQLLDFAQGVAYTVMNGDCQKVSIDANMTRQCIPYDAKLLASGVFGDDHRPVFTYQFTLPGDVHWQVTATVYIDERTGIVPKECGLIHLSYFAPSVNPDSGSLYNMEVMDVGEVKSDDIFDIPKQCQ